MINKLTKDDLEGTRARQGPRTNTKTPVRKADMALMRKLNEVIDKVNSFTEL